jgi:hypothetical protein
MCLMTRAGLPTTNVLGGTSFVTRTIEDHEDGSRIELRLKHINRVATPVVTNPRLFRLDHTARADD